MKTGVDETILAFRERFQKDRRRGLDIDLKSYCALYPGQEDSIEREFELLSAATIALGGKVVEDEGGHHGADASRRRPRAMIRDRDDATRLIAVDMEASGRTHVVDVGSVSSGGSEEATAGVGGEMVGAYRVIREISRGGQGVVYLADDTRLPRRVALKLLLPGYGGEMAEARLLREAEAVAKVDDPCPLHRLRGRTPSGSAPSSRCDSSMGSLCHRSSR